MKNFLLKKKLRRKTLGRTIRSCVRCGKNRFVDNLSFGQQLRLQSAPWQVKIGRCAIFNKRTISKGHQCNRSRRAKRNTIFVYIHPDRNRQGIMMEKFIEKTIGERVKWKLRITGLTSNVGMGGMMTSGMRYPGRLLIVNSYP